MAAEDNALWAWIKGLAIRGWVLISSQIAHIILFLTVNVILGALGFIVPIAIEYANTDFFLPSLKKQLDAAGAYTFAIAFLASCVSLVVAEYLDRKDIAEYRKPKMLLSVMAGLIIIFCSVFSGSQTTHSLGESSIKSPTQATCGNQRPVTAAPNSASITADTHLQAQSAIMADCTLLRKLDVLQLSITSLAVLVGLALFLVFKYQEPSIKEQLAKFVKQTKSDAENLMDGLEIGRR